jgi:CheY-like chemotaxis protein
MSRSSVLIVEDDADVREALVFFLQGEGYEVVEAGHGAEALQELHRNDRVGLILLDLMMPVMNGWEFRAAQTNDPRLAAIPVVIITADHSAARKAADAGAAGCLLKPVDLPDLLDYVGRYCGSA